MYRQQKLQKWLNEQLKTNIFTFQLGKGLISKEY